MPRRAYLADLQLVSKQEAIAGISEVNATENDGEFTFKFSSQEGDSFEVTVFVPELSDYPATHEYHIWAADNAPQRYANALSRLSFKTCKTVSELLSAISSRLGALEATSIDNDTEMADAASSEPEGEFDGGSDSDDEDHHFEQTFSGVKTRLSSLHTNSDTPQPVVMAQRILKDLQKAKEAGFKVGVSGALYEGGSCYITISCRISKLGISEEAMQAWQVEPSDYLILLMHYPSGYRTLEELKTVDQAHSSRFVDFKIGLSKSYKPTMTEAVTAFTRLATKKEEANVQKQEQEQQGSFKPTFISKPLESLFEDRFVTLLRLRHPQGMTWKGAEEFYEEGLRQGIRSAEDPRNFQDDDINFTYPSLVTSDHFDSPGIEHSFPLAAMQFLLRHFVQCTTFCLVCHRKLEGELEAIKPYVCDRPLCLYQYMSLGFGPSIEHEIIMQPFVVDLLVSFCYASAKSSRLNDFPTGLSLSVPPPSEDEMAKIEQTPLGGRFGRLGPVNVSTTAPPSNPSKGYMNKTPAIKMRYDRITHEMIFSNKAAECPVSVGDWITISFPLSVGSRPRHCRIKETTFWPVIKTSEPIYSSAAYTRRIGPAASDGPPAAFAPETKGWVDAEFRSYSINFDTLEDAQKRASILQMIDLLPNVIEMATYLKSKPAAELRHWVDRIPPASLGILRWIIASNRACIMQVDYIPSPAEVLGLVKPPGKRAEERVYGMNDWIQFRFAMGAPDKERRFINSVRDATAKHKLKYPTMFAFHGSPLGNWHSIIREGLHFKETLHGRAYGHGVYHATDANTSMGYSGHGYGDTSGWAGSQLSITTAMALNELVNVPNEFVSRAPYLVVSQLDWIQTRYLFVRSTNTNLIAPDTAQAKPANVLNQDPEMTPRGMNATPIIIPSSAIPRSRRPSSTPAVKKETKRSRKKQKTGNTAADPILIDGEVDDSLDWDNASVATLEEDRELLDEGRVKRMLGHADSPMENHNGPQFDPSKTDFRPGSLDHSTLPKMQEPNYATVAASKRLQADFKALVKVQNSTKLHELGWYISEDLDNLYQWIVELHSFDSALPLAKDMKAKKVTSVVLELRFGKDYPMSPPFVRVVRPRFLSFMQGGGGHVTAGGALCMELLTNNGWSAVSSIESVLLQVRMALCSTEPKPARLAHGDASDYSVGEAVDAYERACRTHGWQVPPGFREYAYGGQAGGPSGFGGLDTPPALVSGRFGRSFLG